MAKKRKAKGDAGSGSVLPVLLPVLAKASDHPCHRCNKCCEYVAIEIDEPTTMKDYDHMVWYLYHQGISVFVDWEKAWYIKFDARCEHLDAHGMCKVYDRRPSICKEFDWRECENHLTPEDGPADKWLWHTADDFLAWLERQRPKAFKRYQRFLDRLHKSDEEPELERLDEVESDVPAAR